MARQTEVVLLLLLVPAATALVTDFNKIIREARTHQGTGNCPSGWVEYGERCYVYQASNIGWAAAERRCLNLGAHLVSIHSYNEYQLVKALIRAYDHQEKPTWIGLNGCQEKFNWFWSDGSKLTFTEWNPNEPNFQNQECCVHVNWSNAKNWNDIPCNLNYPFVCARRI